MRLKYKKCTDIEIRKYVMKKVGFSNFILQQSKVGNNLKTSIFPINMGRTEIGVASDKSIIQKFPI